MGLLGLAVRIGFVVLVAGNRPIIGDALAYHLYGQSIGAGNGMVTVNHAIMLTEVTNPVPTAQLPPLFSYFLGMLDVIGISSVYAQKMAVAVLGALPRCFSVAPAARSGGPRLGPATGVAAAGLAAVYPFCGWSMAA